MTTHEDGDWFERTPGNLQMLAEEEANLAALEDADNAPSDEERVREFAYALSNALDCMPAVDPDYCDAHGLSWVEGVCPEAIEAARACVAVEERHTAALVAEDDRVRGFSMWFDREQWGVIIDALIQHRGHSDSRKAANSESTSDIRSDMCADLIGQLNSAAAALRGPEPTEV